MLRHATAPVLTAWRTPSAVRCLSAIPPAVATHRVALPSATAPGSPSSAATEPTGDASVFAVVGLGSTQFKVTPGDVLAVDKVKGAEVGSTLVVDDVLLVGSRTATVVGRPTVPGAQVHMAVEEQTLDKKVIVFKKKRRKGYKKTQGHRRQLTVLRVTDVVPGDDFTNAHVSE